MNMKRNSPYASRKTSGMYSFGVAVATVLWMGAIAGGEDFLTMELFVMTGGVGTIFFSALMAAIIGMGFIENVRVETMQTLPITGKRVLLNLILPALFLLSISYLVNIAIILVIARMNLLILFFQAFLLAPIMFICTYVGQISTGIYIYTSFPSSDEGSGRLGMPILYAVLGLVPLFLLIIFLTLAFATENIAFGVLGTFLVPAISIPIAYLMFEKAAQNLDALRPTKNIH